MAPEKKSKKPRKNKYEEKVKVEASFDDLMTVLFPPVDSKEECLPKLASKPKDKNKK